MSKLTVIEREDRVTRRAKARDAATAKVELLREWRQARADAARKRAAEQATVRRQRPRGVDRVPGHLVVILPDPKPHLFGKRDVDQVRPLAGPDDLHPMGNHEQRRARGFRGKARKPRRRELPGAVERRLERNRKAAQDLWR